MHVAPIQFGKEIPLFPLPNCVLFPGVVQPLHIFEPRYREMLREALSGQSAIGMALLLPGWESDYYGCPAIHRRICVGRVIAHEQLADGKYNLLLQGVVRADVMSEEKHTGEWGVYRRAMLRPVPENPMGAAHDQLQRRVLKELFEKTALKDLTVTPALASLFELCAEQNALIDAYGEPAAAPENADANESPTARLIDVLAFSLVQDAEVKQRLLEESDLARRGELLTRELIALAGRLGPVKLSTWPPPMGIN